MRTLKLVVSSARCGSSVGGSAPLPTCSTCCSASSSPLAPPICAVGPPAEPASAPPPQLATSAAASIARTPYRESIYVSSAIAPALLYRGHPCPRRPKRAFRSSREPPAFLHVNQQQ